MGKRIFPALLLVALLCGCTQRKQAYQTVFLDVFDTVTTLRGYDVSQQAFDTQAQQVHRMLTEYHNLFDIYTDCPGGLKQVNDQAGIAPVQVEPPVMALLKECKNAYTLTEGRVNVAMGSVLRLWHDAREAGLADPAHAALPAAEALADQLAFERRGIRIIRLEQGYQMVSSGEMADFVTKALETRKPPKLSSSQLEALTIIAYYQPATKAMVEQIRGVDSSYSVAALLNKKLIEEAGRLNVPGRPIQYRTTPDFLRTFGLTSLEELPPIEKITFGEPIGEEGAAPQQEAQA